jgi:glycerophosphoryl diester phosphodiesterase
MKRTLPSALLAAVAGGALTLGLVASAGTANAAPAGTSSPAAHDTTGHRATTRDTPLVLAHRGASGYRPEHTIAAYELAVAMGADYIEPDLVVTKDGVLVDRHEPEISGTTDVADHPEFASRKTTKSLDGVATTGWFTEDFTVAELRTLRAKERLPQIRQESSTFDGRYVVPTFAEVLAARARLSKEYGRTIGIIPELKHSTYLHGLGFDPEDLLVTQVRAAHLNRPSAPLWVQSFELGNLLALKQTYGYKANTVFLATNGGAPYDLVAKGDPRTYAQLLTADSLRSLSRSIDGIGPDKALVIPRTSTGSLGTPTTLVADAHAAGLSVTPWTFRPENTFLPTDYRLGSNPADFGRAVDEVVTFLGTGIDGLFCDQPDICVTARKQFLARD